MQTQQPTFQNQSAMSRDDTELFQVLNSFERLTNPEGPHSIHRTVVFTPRHRVS
jgi:hypothetical protein